MNMFCYQCQEAASGVACQGLRGVCGKTDEQAVLMDLLVYLTKGLSELTIRASEKSYPVNLEEIDSLILDAMFSTITNANFDSHAIRAKILRIIKLKTDILKSAHFENPTDAATWNINDEEEWILKGQSIGVLSTENEDIRSLKELITYGLKGMAAYMQHAAVLGEKNKELNTFMRNTLTDLLSHNENMDDWIALTLKTGEYGVRAMALLDKANTGRYGNPEITEVSIGVGHRPGILVSGHDLKDLEMLLIQSEGKGVDIYTHSEMLPAHYYPFFKKFKHFAGNYGNAWWKQREEFSTFNGPILFTTNCIVPPANDAVYKDKIFTTGSSGLKGATHIDEDANGNKDFSKIIEMAIKSQPPTEIESGSITGGFAHAQVSALSEKIVKAVRSGAIKKFVVMAGCDGRMKSREYYSKFAARLPQDNVILTAGCAKYRYNKLQLGDINGIPRVLDAGQCNDSYSLVMIALRLKEAFGLDDVNKLPIIYNIAWYEQKAVIVLLALLSLGVKNIHLGPTLPAFLSPAVANVLVENFGISGINNAKDDIQTFILDNETEAEV